MFRVALAVFLVTGAANLQLPLFGAYADAANLGSGSMALLLQGYTAALLVCLMSVGGAADAIGQRRVLFASIAVSIVACALVAASPGALALGIARWLQGAGVGFVMGAGTAWLAHLTTPKRAAGISGLASTAGFAGGALATTAAVAIHPGAAPIGYALWAVALAINAMSLARLDAGPLPTPRPSLVRLPSFPPGSLRAGLGIATGWAVAGIAVAVLPGVLRGLGAESWASAVLFVLLASGVLAQAHATRIPAASATRWGAAALTLGTALLAVGVAVRSVPILLVGAALSGTATHGWLYVGGLAQVALVAPRSASAVSGFFVWAYIGFGIPAILAGMAVDTLGPTKTFAGLSVAVTLACLALWLSARPPVPTS